MTLYPVHQLAPIDPEALAAYIHDLCVAGGQPFITMLLVRSSNPAYAKLRENRLAVLLSVEDYEKLLDGCKAVEHVHDAMERIGCFSDYAKREDLP